MGIIRKQVAPTNPPPQRPTAPGGVRLVESGESVESTPVRETDAHTALTRGLCEYLMQQEVETPEGTLRFASARYDWAVPEQRAEVPCLSVYGDGDGTYQDARMVSGLDSESARLPDNTRLLVSAELVQELAVDIECTDPVQRRRLAGLVEAALNPLEGQYGMLLLLPHYHSEVGSYSLQRMAYDDDPEDARRRDRKGRFIVEARVRVVRPFGIVPARPRARIFVDDVEEPAATGV